MAHPSNYECPQPVYQLRRLNILSLEESLDYHTDYVGEAKVP